jgi:MFS transporter, DHA1 family, staphyloferrin A biosynthesis exporter
LTHSVQDETAPPTVRPAATGAGRLFTSLHHRDWRLLWSGLMVVQLGEWMDSTALNWLVLVQTNSPFMLGMVNFARGFPNIVLSAAGGVIADRVDRRTMLLVSQSLGFLLTVGLAAIATAGSPELWQIYTLVGLRGIVAAFNGPARGSIIGDLVPRDDIMNAMALNSSTFNATRMVGPAIAGVIIAAGGTAIVLWINAATYLVNITAMLAMSGAARRVKAPTGSAFQTLTEGFRYIGSNPVVMLLMLLGTLPFVLGQPYQSMLPVFARDVLNVGPTGLGFLMTASAVGSLLGAFSVAGLAGLQRKGLVMSFALISFGLTLLAFAVTPWPIAAGALLFLAGASFQVYGTTNASLIQMIVPSEFRGRVLGVWQMDRGLIPVGSFLAGLIAEQAGAPFAVGLMATALAMVALAVLVLSPRIRGLE